jgi:uncharacterized phage protein (TIGR01671 family)
MKPTFRAWHKDGRVMCKVSILELEQVSGDKPQSVLLESKLGVGWFPIESVVLMQSIGLKDKNEKEIFEEDIIKFMYSRKERIAVVRGANNLIFGYLVQIVGYGSIFLHEIYSRPIEIIGNSYENPEMLKGEKI